MHFTIANNPTAPAQPVSFSALPVAEALLLSAPQSSLNNSSSGYSSGSGSEDGAGSNGGFFAPGAKARVVWVGNVKADMHRDELKAAFTLALGEELVNKGYRVAHIRVQRQRRMPFNSATVFFNRSVNLEGLAHRLRFVAKQPLLTIRKCSKKSQQPKKGPGFKHAWGAPVWPPLSLESVAIAEATAYFDKMSTPLPAEIGLGTQPFLDFVQELEEAREPMDLILNQPLLV